MPTYAEREADYERRRQEGFGNPFSGLLDKLLEPAPPGTVAQQPTSEADVTPVNPFTLPEPAQGTPYDNVGWEGLKQELSEGLIAEPTEPSFEERKSAYEERNVEAKRQEANVAAAQAEAEAALARAAAPNEGESEDEANVRSNVYQLALKDNDKWLANEMLRFAKEKPNASVEDTTAVYSDLKKESVEKTMKESGQWTDVFKESWDNFNNKVDLFTMGVALMATSGNGQGMATNLGMAIGAGAAAKQAQIDRGVATEAAARKEARDERAIADKEEKSRIDLINAYTRRIEAMATSGGTKYYGATESSRDQAALAFQEAGVNIGEFEGPDGKLEAEHITSAVGSAIETRMKGATPEELRDPNFAARVRKQAMEHFMTYGGYKNTAYVGQDWERAK